MAQHTFNPFLEDINSYRFERAYRAENAGWDIGRPQTAIAHIIENGEIHGDVIDIGCGTGIHSLMIAQRGHRVLGVDFSPTAVQICREKARRNGIKADFLTWNALNLSRLNHRFDTAVDSACYHCLNQQDREKYEKEVRQIVRPGGTLFLLCSTESVPLDEIRERFSHGWSIESVRRTVYEYTESEIDAYLVKVRRTS